MIIFLIRILPLIATLLGMLSGASAYQLANDYQVYAQAQHDGTFAAEPNVLDYTTPIVSGVLSVLSLAASMYFGSGSTAQKLIDSLGGLVKPSVTPQPASDPNLILLQAFAVAVAHMREMQATKSLPGNVEFRWLHGDQKYLFYVGPDKEITHAAPSVVSPVRGMPSGTETRSGEPVTPSVR